MIVKIFKNKEELSFSFCTQLSEMIKSKEKYFIALSGGSTPKIVFQTLAENFKSKIDWSKVHLFWGDERCVPPDHSESNFGMTKEYLINHINIPEENIHRIKGENDPVEESIRYSEEIKKNLPDQNNLPQFDLIMLGIGEDGHTASIFPDQIKIIESEKICETAIHPETKQKRITLTGRVINNSQNIFFLITGNKKSLIVDQIINKKNNFLRYPASHINPLNGELYFYLDSVAASLLNQKEYK